MVKAVLEFYYNDSCTYLTDGPKNHLVHTNIEIIQVQQDGAFDMRRLKYHSNVLPCRPL